MDDLTRDSTEAIKHKMSYGKYMATVKPFLPAVECPTPKPEAPIYGQQRHSNCILCGQPIPQSSKNRKYCGKACSEMAYRQQQRDNDRKRREKRKQH